MRFPVGPASGKCIPVFCEKTGHAFRPPTSGAYVHLGTPSRVPSARTFLPLLRHFVDRSVACPHARVYSKRYFSYAIRCRFDLHDSKGAVMERILGVNLSGWFIPEPWVTPSLYAATGASNAAELQEAMGTAAYNERMRLPLRDVCERGRFSSYGADRSQRRAPAGAVVCLWLAGVRRFLHLGRRLYRPCY